MAFFIGLGIVAIVGGVGSIIKGVSDQDRIAAAREVKYLATFKPATATIESTSIETTTETEYDGDMNFTYSYRKTSRNITRYRLIVVYQFQTLDQIYYTGAKTFSWGSLAHAETQKVKYPLNTKINIRYDPKQPEVNEIII